MLFLVGEFDLVFPSDFWLQPGVLDSELVVLCVFIFDHVAEFFLFLVVLEEVIFELSGFAFGVAVLLLPVVYFPLEVVVTFLHLGRHLFVLAYLDLIVLVVIYFAVEF